LHNHQRSGEGSCTPRRACRENDGARHVEADLSPPSLLVMTKCCSQPSSIAIVISRACPYRCPLTPQNLEPQSSSTIKTGASGLQSAYGLRLSRWARAEGEHPGSVYSMLYLVACLVESSPNVLPSAPKGPKSRRKIDRLGCICCSDTVHPRIVSATATFDRATSTSVKKPRLHLNAMTSVQDAYKMPHQHNLRETLEAAL